MNLRRFAFRRWPLGAKLAATFAAVIALAVLGVSHLVISWTRTALEHDLRERGADAAENLSRLGADLVLEEDLWGLYNVVRGIVVADEEGGNLVTYAVVTDPAGRVLAHSDPPSHPIGELAASVASPWAPYRLDTTWSVDGTADEVVHHFSAPIVVDNQRIAIARIGVSPRQLDATIGRITRAIVVLGILLQELGALLGYVIARRMTRPLTELGRAVDRIAAGELEQPLAVSTTEKDEIGALADRFNLMSRRLRDSQRDTREAQERLIRTERLASVGECAGALAHEIRNPLGAVVAAARMLSSSAPQAQSYDREKLAAVIADEARRLNRILSDFLVFARPRPPSRQPHSMSALVAELVELLRLDELASGRAIEARGGPESAPCEMDRDQVKQVLWNLLRNALEATPPGGRVLVETIPRGDAVAVEISDDGPGLPAERLGRLFEPFFTTKRRGAGLGLAIAHRIVTAHGGTIAASSSPGQGTRMCVTLPLRASGPAGKDAAA